MKNLLFILLATLLVYACGTSASDTPGEDIAEGINLSELGKGLEELAENMEAATDNETTATADTATGQHLPYKADAMWQKAIKNFEAGLHLMPTKGIQIEGRSREVGDKSGEAEVKISGLFLYKDSLFALFPKKVEQKGEVKEYDLKKPKARDYQTDKWMYNYALSDECMLAILSSNMQNKIGVVPTGETVEHEGVKCAVYDASLTVGSKIVKLKALIEASSAMPRYVYTESGNKSAKGGHYYEMAANKDGICVVNNYKVEISLNLMGIAKSGMLTEFQYTEHGKVVVE